jgi:hypothetical protein
MRSDSVTDASKYRPTACGQRWFDPEGRPPLSRSKHTRPLRIRAEERVRAPHDSRGHGDGRIRRAARRTLKELGIVDADSADTDVSREVRFPRIVEKMPRDGYVHPACKADIATVLSSLGEVCFYGLRSIELVRGPNSAPWELALGRLTARGRILLYDQRPSPWRLGGRLDRAQREKLERAGARIKFDTVDWPGETLAHFMLFDVLMHEVGHHVLQHHKGKRAVHIARTSDHEAFADRFARRCRLAFERS